MHDLIDTAASQSTQGAVVPRTGTDAAAGTCRVCASRSVSSLPIGVYAPFFCLRVDVSKDRHALYSAPGGLQPVTGNDHFTRALRAAQRALARVRGPRSSRFLRTHCDFCAACRSLALTHAYGEADLTPLYADYRSARYNQERSAVEPTYAAIASRVGDDPRERASRNAGVAAFLMPELSERGPDHALLLDVGGSDGRFIPPEVVACHDEIHVVDTSDADIDATVASHGVRKVALPDPRGYDLVTCMHVLEHVGSPRQFVTRAIEHLKPGGCLYLEVPLELDPATPGQFASRNVDRWVAIHEHINQYDADSVSRLIESIPSLRLLKSEAAVVDCGWTTGRVGRYLARHVR